MAGHICASFSDQTRQTLAEGVHGKRLTWDLGEPGALSQGALTFGGITVGGFLVYISSENPQTHQAATARLDDRSAFSIPTV